MKHFILKNKIKFQTKFSFVNKALMLTNYAHFEWRFSRFVSSKTCKELSETTISKTGCCSGSVQDFIGGHNPSLSCLLLEKLTRQVHKCGKSVSEKYFCFVNKHYRRALLVTEPLYWVVCGLLLEVITSYNSTSCSTFSVLHIITLDFGLTTNVSNALPTTVLSFICVDALNATTGYSSCKHCIHFSTFSCGTRSTTQNM